ncbi:MAG: hypothetical protein WAM14_16370 [Candidatus Nitrosopolaris sp.]
MFDSYDDTILALYNFKVGYQNARNGWLAFVRGNEKDRQYG